MKVGLLIQSFVSTKLFLRVLIFISFISMFTKIGFSQEGQIIYIPIEIRGSFNFYRKWENDIEKIIPRQ